MGEAFEFAMSVMHVFYAVLHISFYFTVITQTYFGEQHQYDLITPTFYILPNVCLILNMVYCCYKTHAEIAQRQRFPVFDLVIFSASVYYTYSTDMGSSTISFLLLMWLLCADLCALVLDPRKTSNSMHLWYEMQTLTILTIVSFCIASNLLYKIR